MRKYYLLYKKLIPVDLAFIHYLAVIFVLLKNHRFLAPKGVSGGKGLWKYFPGQSMIMEL